MGIFDAFSSAPGQKAAQDQVNALNQGKQDLQAQYALGNQALNTNYTNALQPYTQEYGDYTQGTDSLADALGLNGPGGSARAVSAFQANPGYQFQQQQGANAVLANQARTGQLSSGNTDLALQQQGQNIANQGWNGYISNLQPYLGARSGAATGIAGVDTGLGNALSANYTGLGSNLAGLDTATGKAQAGGDMAGYNASANLIGAGLGLAGDAAKLGGGGAGNYASSLFGRFLSPAAT